MAGDGERRMLFDIRGRRRNVVRVVYAILALLMGGSLFLTVGPFNLSEIVGGGGSSSASEVFDDQVERIEGRLAKEPTDEALLLALTRARISAAAAKTEGRLEGESPEPLTPEARDDYEGALEAWDGYLKQAGDEPSPAAAQLVATTYFTLAERGSATLEDLETNGGAALRAQRIAVEARPNLGTLSTLALYEFFYGDIAAGDKATKQALAKAPSKGEAESVKKQLTEFRKQGLEYQKSIEKFKAQQQKAGGQGEPFQNPFSLGGASAGQ